MHKNNWKKLIRDYIEKQKKMIKKKRLKLETK
jgi:hypothetical protein